MKKGLLLIPVRYVGGCYRTPCVLGAPTAGGFSAPRIQGGDCLDAFAAVQVGDGVRRLRCWDWKGQNLSFL